MPEPTKYETQLVSEYGQPMQDLINVERGKNGTNNLLRGVNVDPEDVNRLISTFKSSNIYSPANTQQTLTSPAIRPNLSDPMGLYDYYVNSADIQAANKEYQAAFGELMKAKATGREQQTAIEALPQALNVIRGEQAQAGRLASDRIAALAEAADVSFSKLAALRQTGTERFNIAQGQRAELTNLIMNNPGAGIKYTDTIENASKKAYNFGVKIAKEERDKKYKDSLKAIALEFGLKTSGSKKALEKRIRKYNKSALNEAKKMRDLQYESALLDIQKKRESMGRGGMMGGGETIDIGSLFGDSSSQSSTGNYDTGGAASNYFNSLGK